VMRIGKELFIGLSDRTDQAGVDQLAAELEPFGYRVATMVLHDCLHLKSVCCYLGDNSILINQAWVDTEPLRPFRLIDVAPDEPAGANALRVADTILMASAYPNTAAVLRKAGCKVRALDLSELLKAESGVTCSSLIFESNVG